MTMTAQHSTKAITVDDDATTLSTSALSLVNALKIRNCPVDAMLQEADIDPTLLTQMGKRIPIRKMEVFWKAAVRETGDPAIGITTAEHFKANYLHAFHHVIQACDSIGEALQQIVRFSAVISTVIEIDFLQHKEEVELVFRVREGYPSPCHEAMDAVAAITLNSTVANIGLSKEDVTLIQLPRSLPDNPELWLKRLDVPVSFGADFLRIGFKANAMNRPVLTASPEIADTNSELLQRYLEGLNQNFVSRARQQLTDLLKVSEGTQEALASALNMSARSLQRRLQSENTSFRHLLDEIRQQQAMSEMKYSQKPITDIALELGFSDSGSFSRAFKRWTGLAPSQYRQQNATS